jgi:hypothetical protein
MEGKYIKVTIDPTGSKMSVDMEGFHGQGCKAIAEAFDSMGTVINEEDKAELYTNSNQNVLHSEN